MTIWHWNEGRLQSRQQADAKIRKKLQLLCPFYDVQVKSMLLLQISSMLDLRFFQRGATLWNGLIFAYELDINLNGQNYQWHLHCGPKNWRPENALHQVLSSLLILLFQTIYNVPSWFYGKHGFLWYDFASGTSMNITEKFVTFVDVEDDHM